MITKRIFKFIGCVATLLCLTACVFLKPAALVSFEREYNKVETNMTKTEVEALLGRPRLTHTELGAGWGPIPPTTAIYVSTNLTGTRGFAMITYCISNVISKTLTTGTSSPIAP